MSREPVQPEVVALIDKVCADLETAVEQCRASRGPRKGDLKTSKPKNGIYAYVWRMARFHSGDDVTMPMAADYDLSEGIEKETGIRVRFFPLDDSRKALLDKLDNLSEEVCVKLGRSRDAGLRRWGRALGMI